MSGHFAYEIICLKFLEFLMGNNCEQDIMLLKCLLFCKSKSMQPDNDPSARET